MPGFIVQLVVPKGFPLFPGTAFLMPPFLAQPLLFMRP